MKKLIDTVVNTAVTIGVATVAANVVNKGFAFANRKLKEYKDQRQPKPSQTRDGPLYT